MSRCVHRAWLKVTAIVILAAAPIFLLGSMTATAEPARLLFDLLKWPVDGAETYEGAELRFASALLAGFLAGWGIMVWRLRNVYDHAPEAVRRAILSGTLAWFAIDSLGSLFAGAASNLIFNAIIALLAVGPLWRPAIEDRG